MGDGSPDDYHALLGLDAEADGAELRRAWRRLALRWHPDRAGPGATSTFQKILAAHTVLSDPLARAAYDRRRGAPARNPGVRPGDAPRAPPAATRRRAPGVMLHRMSGSLNTLLACGSAERAEDGVIELFLNEQEASEGGMVTISMPVPVRCPAWARTRWDHALGAARSARSMSSSAPGSPSRRGSRTAPSSPPPRCSPEWSARHFGCSSTFDTPAAPPR